jgi:lipopolysaccharide/colanic/teichoic acid biosynthesis glycosyltransferase
VKRVLDIILSIAILLLSLPIVLGAVLAIYIEDGMPLMFRQQRIGRDGVPFTLHKLRTMRASAGPAVTQKGDTRITRVGRFLRASKVDELPQLLNILRGDMSFVGPRPEVPEMVGKMDKEKARIRHSIRPGLTSPASVAFIDEEQILSRYPDPISAYVNIVLPQKLDLDVAYALNRSLAGDVRVIVETAKTLLFKRESVAS